MKTVYVVLLTACILATCSFDSCGIPSQPGTVAGGFPVTTYSVTEDTAGNILSNGVVPGTGVTGNWVADLLRRSGFSEVLFGRD
jgi:hypothetical protein